jgi:hypothetical protein
MKAPQKILTSMGATNFMSHVKLVSWCKLKLWYLNFCHKKNKIMSHVKLMSWCKLKLWHLKFHHNENPQKHLSLQWVQSVLYWEQMQHVMCKWIHICNDVDSGQQVKKPLEHFLSWEWGLLSRFWIPCYIRMGAHM